MLRKIWHRSHEISCYEIDSSKSKHRHRGSPIALPVTDDAIHMRTCHAPISIFALIASLVLFAGCGRPQPAAETPAAVPHAHEHKAPHDGTPVVLGDEVYHLELVRDAVTGTLQAYVLDGEMENFIRVTAPDLTIATQINGAPQALVLRAIASGATGETIGNTALFEGQADWLKTTPEFDGTLKTFTIRGTTFTDVKFNFPKGNDKD